MGRQEKNFVTVALPSGGKDPFGKHEAQSKTGNRFFEAIWRQPHLFALNRP